MSAFNLGDRLDPETSPFTNVVKGAISSTISKKTNYVIYGSNYGSKLNKAKEMNIKIISEQEFSDMVEENY